VKKLVLLAAGGAALVLAAVAFAGNGTPINRGSANALTLAVYGDSPYGLAPPAVAPALTDISQLQATPALIDSINSDPKVDLVLHVGDTHSGSEPCYAHTADNPIVGGNSVETVFNLWQAYKDPLVYTPGDNEWTDCTKKKEGGAVNGVGGVSYYDASQPGHLPGDPLDNLAFVRGLFFANPGVTLGGRKKQVLSQGLVDPAYPAFVENVLWEQSKVVFATVNVTGSNNDTLPWYGNGKPLPVASLQSRQRDEVTQRTAAAISWLDRAFAQATADDAAGVVIGMQADMWDIAQRDNGEGLNGYDGIVDELASLAKAFGKPVLLINGDSHQFEVDRPLSSAFYGAPANVTVGDIHHVGYAVPNLQRITVEGSTFAQAKWWLKLTVDPSTPDVFSWEPVQLP
jgi:hypothetical protein